MRRFWGVALRVAALGVVGFVLVHTGAGAAYGRAGEHARSGKVSSVARTGGQDEQHATADRLAALAQATSDGRFGLPGAATSMPAPGWLGSRVLNQAKDDWEPAVATDPRAPYVYLLTTRYTPLASCPGHCPTPYIVITRSADGGTTWGKQRPLCTCLGTRAQYDPIIEVVPNTGVVYALFLSTPRGHRLLTMFSKSVDHGRTWSTPAPVYGSVRWTDKPELATDRSGKDVYVSFNGPTVGDLYVAQSHDFGATWTQQRLTHDKRYYYAYDGRVLPDGTVVFSESSISYTQSGVAVGRVFHHAVISRDHGATWSNQVLARVPVGESCVADGCGSDFYIGQTSVVADRPRHLVFAYEGPRQSGRPQRVYVVRSADAGRTWARPIALSSFGEDATGPRLASSGGGDVRIWYMQTAGHDNPDAWNVLYRTSSNGGRTWSSPTKIDDAPRGAAGYVNRRGFDEIYGDYGEIAVTNTGKTVAVWGEGFSYTGPGGTWFNVQR